MGIEVVVIGTGKKASQVVGLSANIWTSTITVQGHQGVNVGIRIGSQISDILSAVSFSTTLSAVASVFSGTVTLQKRMAEESESYHWRDVASWAISSSAAAEGGSENITASNEPETCQYRLGIKTGAYTAGLVHLRLGTS